MYSFLYLEWFQLSWCSFITAIIFSGRFAAKWRFESEFDDLLQKWYIRIWIWCQKQTFWLKRLNWSSVFVTGITTRDDLVLYWEDCALSASTTSLLVEIEVFDLFWFCTTWCPSSSIELNLDIALRLGHLVSIVYIYSWWFCIAWLFGDFIETLRIDFAGDCVM